MDIGSIFVILALVIFALAFIARPLFEKNGFKDTYQGNRLSTFLAERERILALLQELDADYAMGKIGEIDYASQRSALVMQGATVLRNIDLQQGTHARRQESGEALSVEEQLDLQIEADIAQKRKTMVDAFVKYCAQCGTALPDGNHVCSRCGTPVAAAETEA